MKTSVNTAKPRSSSPRGKHVEPATKYRLTRGRISSITAIAVVNTKYPHLKVLDILPDTKAYLDDLKNSPAVLNKSEHLRRIRIVDMGEIK